MSENHSETTENQHIKSPFDLLTDSQWRFVTAMIDNPEFTKKDAAEYIGITPDTTYRWGKHVNEAIELGRKDIHRAALARRKQALLKAISVKVKLLESEDEAIRSKAATELIEWELGKAMQPTDVTTQGEKLKGYAIFSPDQWDDDTD